MRIRPNQTGSNQIKPRVVEAVGGALGRDGLAQAVSGHKAPPTVDHPKIKGTLVSYQLPFTSKRIRLNQTGSNREW